MRRFIMAGFAALILAVVVLGVGVAPAQAEDVCDKWGYHFTYELPAGYWSVGTHTYEFYQYDAPLDLVYDFDVQTFTVSSQANGQRGQVFLRPTGLRAMSGTITAIHPSEDTLLQVTMLMDSTNYWYVNYHSSTQFVMISIDGGSWISLEPSDTLSHCTIWTYNPYFWSRNWMLDY